MEKVVVHNDGSVGCVFSKSIYEEAFAYYTHVRGY